MEEKALIVIPARMGSTRFFNKPMVDLLGKTMIERVWLIAKAVKKPVDVIIATDDLALYEFVKSFGADAIMTSKECPTGTDRVAEVSYHRPSYSIFFSLQGDAPLTPPWVIEAVLDVMLKNSDVEMATPAVRLENEALDAFVKTKESGSSSGTSVVFDRNHRALYFSKALIPFQKRGASPIFRHIGLYGYRKKTLQRLVSLPEGVLEKGERLEQLRALENQIPIQVVEVDYRGRTHGSIDQPSDVAEVLAIIEKEGELLSCV